MAFSPTEPRVYADVTTHTMWGDIAYQLGGAEPTRCGDCRRDRLCSGADTIIQLLEDYGPALIMIDELVAFARNLPVTTADRIPAGTFDSTMTFVQNLTEAVKRSSDSMLLVSIPESDNEIGGELGKQALDILAKTIGRVSPSGSPSRLPRASRSCAAACSQPTLTLQRVMLSSMLLARCTGTTRRIPIRCRGERLCDPHEIRVSYPSRAVRPALSGLVYARPVPAHTRCPAAHGNGDSQAVAG